MAVPEHSVTSSRPPAATARVGRALRSLRPAGALALLVSGVLGLSGIAAAQTPSSLSGTWQLSCPGRNGRVRHITLQIEQSGGKLIGSFSARRRAGKLSGSVHGNQVSLQMGADGRSITLTGTTDGNSMTVQRPRGGSCSASRQ